MWYNYDKLISYNAILNFVIGERGVGKTYGATKFVLNEFIKKGVQFIYLRRYKTELKNSVPKFFDALINNNEFKDHKLKVKDNTFYCDGKICGYAIALSTANILKSTSFAKVKTIIFDEFIIDKGVYHYLQNEVTQMLDIVETIGRLRDIRMLFLGNAISITNPYFNYFSLTLPYKSDFKTFKNGLILVNYIKNEKYREVKKASRFGQLIENTEYGKYAIDNEFLRDSKSFVGKKQGECKHQFILIVNNQKLGVWYNYDSTIMYVSQDYDPNCPIIFTLEIDSHTDSTILIKTRSNTYYKFLVESFRLGKLYFESQQIKNNVLMELSKTLTY